MFYAPELFWILVVDESIFILLLHSLYVNLSANCVNSMAQSSTHTHKKKKKKTSTTDTCSIISNDIYENSKVPNKETFDHRITPFPLLHLTRQTH